MRSASPAVSVGRIVTAATVVMFVVPILVLTLEATSTSWFFPDPFPRHLTWNPLREAWANPAVRHAAVTGATVSTVVTVLVVLVAWPAARVLARPGLRGRGMVIAILFLPSVLPGVGLAMGIDVALLRLHLAGGLPGVVIAHLVPTIPYGVAALTATFARHDWRIDAQAAVLGASPLQRLRLVTIPLLRSGAAAAAALVFVVSWSQYLLTVLAGSGRVVTITMLLFSALSGGNTSTIGVLALITALPAVLLVTAAGHQNAGANR